MVLIVTAHITFLFGMWYVLILKKKKKKFPEDVSLNFEVIGVNNSEFSNSQLFLLITLF